MSWRRGVRSVAAFQNDASVSSRVRVMKIGNSALAVLGLLLAGHTPFLVSYFQMLWELEHYQFFPFAIVALGGLAYQRACPEQFQWSWACSVLIVLDLILVGLGIVLPSAWPVMAGLICAIAAVLLASHEVKIRGSLLYLIALPLLMLRLPLGLDLKLIAWLQSVTSWSASAILHRLGYIHFRAGNVLELTDKSLLVEEACSGIQSLFTMVFIAVFIFAWRRRGILHGALLVVAGIFWAGILNVVRVVGIAVAWREYNLDLTTGWQHDVWGYVVLVGAILMLLSSDIFLESLTSFVPDPIEDSDRFRNPFTSIWNGIFQQGPRLKEAPLEARPAPWIFRSPVVALVLAAVCIYGQTRDGFAAPSAALRATSEPDILSENDLPREANGWKRQTYEVETRRAGNSFGEYSNRWTFARGQQVSLVSCDHAFRGWHPLESCYQARGWRVEDKRVLSIEQDPEWPAVAVDLRRPTGERSVLIYSLFDAQGNGASPPEESVGAAFLNRVFRKSTLVRVNGIDPVLFQSQVFREVSQKFQDQDWAELTEYHQMMRSQMRDKYLERNRE